MTRREKKEFNTLKFSMTDYNVSDVQSRYSNRNNFNNNSKYEVVSDKRESLINKFKATNQSQITSHSARNQNPLFVGAVDIDSKFACEDLYEQEE